MGPRWIGKGVAAVENWWEKYRVTLKDVEIARNAASAALDGYLGSLSYV